MTRGSTLPDLKNTLQFCQFLLDCSEEDYHDNLIWVRETRQHKLNLKKLLEVLESEDFSMVTMGRKQYENCVKTFGRELAAKIFKDVTIVEKDTKPTSITELLSKMKAGNAAERTKIIKQPNGFYTENAGKAFQDALFHRNGTNGHKGMPTMATTFSQLRQARIEGELAEQFTMLSQNILLSNEYSAEVKAQKMANLVAEYSDLVKGGK